MMMIGWGYGGYIIVMMLINNIERINEDKDAQIRMLQFQVAKHRTDGNTDGKTDDVQDAIFRKEAWKQIKQQEQISEQKTMEACQNEDNTLQCYNGSVGDLQPDEVYSDD